MKPVPRGVMTGFHPMGAPAPVPVQPSAPPSGIVPEGLLACTACSARQDALRVVPGAGPADAVLCFIGQNPGDEEDLAGRPFIGRAGDEFDRWLTVLGIDRQRVYVTNAVKCHTRDNRPPKTLELKTCYQWLAEELKALTSVKVVVPLGRPATERLLAKSTPAFNPPAIHHFKVLMLGREVSVFPLPHPAYLLRAQHLGPTFRDILLPQVRETLQQELPDVYNACRRS